MKKVITILAALVVSVSFATAADAEKKGEKKARATPEEKFKKLDTNADGSVSADEFKAGAKDAAKADAAFAQKDTDKDGKLSLAECTAAPAKKEKAAK
jgi:Ca2+-binding EF-hand superfamily protein